MKPYEFWTTSRTSEQEHHRLRVWSDDSIQVDVIIFGYTRGIGGGRAIGSRATLFYDEDTSRQVCPRNGELDGTTSAKLRVTGIDA